MTRVGTSERGSKTAQKILVIIVLAALPVSVLGMGGREQVPASVNGQATIRDVRRSPAGFSGKEVAIEGVFRGWAGTCAGAVPQTRSDWVLEDGTGCIYVSGLLPSGASAAAPRGERIVVAATVKLGREGAPYLAARSATVLPVARPK